MPCRRSATAAGLRLSPAPSFIGRRCFLRPFKTLDKDSNMGVVKTYPLRVAAKAAQAPQRKQRRWIDTNVVPLRANKHKASGSGNRCGLSRARILQIAITEVLLKSGVSLSSAAKAAFEFS